MAEATLKKNFRQHPRKIRAPRHHRKIRVQIKWANDFYDFYFPIRKDSSRHKQDIIPLFIKRVHNKQDIRYVTYLEENVSRDKKILAKQ